MLRQVLRQGREKFRRLQTKRALARSARAACVSPVCFESIESRLLMSMSVISFDLVNNMRFPAAYTEAGGNQSLPVRWLNIPQTTQQIAVTMEDISNPGFYNWVVYNLPKMSYLGPDVGHSVTLASNGNATQGLNSFPTDAGHFNSIGYYGPTATGTAHDYRITVYALDQAMNLPQGLTGSDLLTAIGGHVLDSASLTGHASASNSAPTMTSVSTITGGAMNQDVAISYATLLAQSNLTDADTADTVLAFHIEAVTSGTLKKGGVNVSAGSTYLYPGESLTWTPASNVTGTLAAFTISAFDGAASSAAPTQVSVQVTGVPHPPTLTSISNLSTATEDQDFTISYNTLKNASDAADQDGDNISFRIEVVSSGDLKKNGNPVVAGSTTLSAGESLVWHPDANANGTLDAFTVLATDGSQLSSTPVQVHVVTSAVNDVPTLTTVSTLNDGTPGVPFTITYAALSAAANEADVDNQPLSFRIEAVSSGTLTKNGVAVTAGVTTIGSGESLVWTPANSNMGTFNAFTVVASDGTAVSSGPVQVQVAVSQSVTVDPPDDISVPAGKTIFVPLTATDSQGRAITWSASSTNTNFTTTFVPITHYLKLSISIDGVAQGDLYLGLFDTLAPNTVAQISALVNSGFYNGRSFPRIVPNFMAQGGRRDTGDTRDLSFNDEFDPRAIFSTYGLLAMANRGDDTNDTEFFITATPYRSLDFNYNIFGMLLHGQDVFDNMMAQGTPDPAPTNGVPLKPVTITSASIVANNHDGVMIVRGPSGVGASTTITVTADNNASGVAQQTFTATTAADVDSWGNPVNDPPFLAPIANNQWTKPGQALTINLTSTDLEGSSVLYGFGVLDQATNDALDATTTFDQATGVLKIVPKASFFGTLNVIVGVTQDNGNTWDTQVIHVTVSYVPPGTRLIATGTNGGSQPWVKVFNADTGDELYRFLAYDSRYYGQVRVALGDVNGDGIADICTSTGPGGLPLVQIFDGATGVLYSNQFVYNQDYLGGVEITLANVWGDGKLSVITATDRGGLPLVNVFNQYFTLQGNFWAFDPQYYPGYVGGVRIGAADFEHNGRNAIAVTTGSGGVPIVCVFSYSGTGYWHEISNMYVEDDLSLQNGLQITGGDVEGTGSAAIISAHDAGSPAIVKAFRTGDRAKLLEITAFANFTGGLRIASTDCNGDGHADIIVVPGPGMEPRVKVFDGITGNLLNSWLAYDAALTNGLYVAAG